MSTRIRKKWSVNGKAHRITISLDKEICRKTHALQEVIESKIGTGWSTAKTINLLILAGFLSQKSLHRNDWSLIRDLSQGKKIDIDSIDFEDFLENLFYLYPEIN
ncbi:MAG: hypothetical protein O3C48_06935 [Crenarchaeota archaeon]|nr:hypothetical protein [Thermoproteota archaeon]